MDFLLSLRELFTLVAYGLLIREKAGMHNVDKNLVDRIFDFMVCDFSRSGDLLQAHQHARADGSVPEDDPETP